MNQIKKTESALALCFKYSNNPEKLREILAEMTIEYTDKGIYKFFPDDPKPRQVRTIVATRNINGRNAVISFDFGMSIADTEILTVGAKLNPHYKSIYGQEICPIKTKQQRQKIENDFLYSVLCCIASDGIMSANSFQEFCDEFGYNNDSIKARDTYLACLEQRSKILRLFSVEDLQAFPR